MRIHRLAALSIIVAGLLATRPTLAETRAEPRDLCDSAVSQAETEIGLPRFMLHAVSLAESRRWDAAEQAGFAWPWTVTAGGKGRFFPTKADAIAHVEKLQQAGRRNIDVGCMQINLRYHPDAFENLEDAFDPAVNAAYAARFLKRLIDEKRSWSRAVGTYHSSTMTRSRAYATKVFAIWNKERRERLEAERLARIAAYRARRQAARR